MKKTYLHGDKKYPFKFNLLRLMPDGRLLHINSIFKNYNDDNKVTGKKEFENNRVKYIICKSIKEMEERLQIIKLSERPNCQTLFIIAKFKGGYSCA